ncbi:MAG: hypothetical protein FWD57_15230, partial [Polyangiaceae bacterium]|nr:hypothetical protein [Polyangiaceae bacterium]
MGAAKCLRIPDCINYRVMAVELSKYLRSLEGSLKEGNEEVVNKPGTRVLHIRVLVSALLCGVLTMLSMVLPNERTAMAQEQPNDGRSNATGSSADEKKTRFRHFTITVNPITMLFARVGINIEYLPVPHHGFMLFPNYMEFGTEFNPIDSEADTYKLYGFELSYHFYSGTKGANGFFAGPTLVIQRDKYEYETGWAADRATVSGQSNISGFAFDFGGQHIFDSGFTIGGGMGIMRLTRDK